MLAKITAKNQLTLPKSLTQAVGAIDWPKGFCRKDIGHRAIARLHK